MDKNKNESNIFTACSMKLSRYINISYIIYQVYTIFKGTWVYVKVILQHSHTTYKRSYHNMSTNSHMYRVCRIIDFIDEDNRNRDLPAESGLIKEPML